jgi:hypothetical protein
MYAVNLISDQRCKQEQAQADLRELIRNAINDGADRLDDLQDSELQLMTAAAIHAADPEQAWQFIAEAPGADSYPGLVADALGKSHGGFLGLERTENRLVRAILSGAIRYARKIIEKIFREEKQRKEWA